jgi:hypothetical protein
MIGLIAPIGLTNSPYHPTSDSCSPFTRSARFAIGTFPLCQRNLPADRPRTHLQDLIETTAQIHYETFRSKQLLALKESSAKAQQASQA